MSAEPFTPYDVPGVGRVIAHEAGWYHVQMIDGRVCGFPASTTPSEASAPADIAYAIANPTVSQPRWRVLKDTLWMRAKELGYQAGVTAAINSLPSANRMDFDCQTWFWSDNDPIRLVLEGVECTPEHIAAIMAPDPLAP